MNTPKILRKEHSELLACYECGRLLYLLIDKKGPVIGCVACDEWEQLWRREETV